MLLLSSCKTKLKFDKKVWCSYSDLGLHEERNQMVDDLLKNHQFKGKEINDIQEFFGCIESVDTLMFAPMTESIRHLITGYATSGVKLAEPSRFPEICTNILIYLCELLT